MKLQFSYSSLKPHYTRLRSLVIISSSICILYLLLSLFSVHSKLVKTRYLSGDDAEPTDLRHIAFGIASSTEAWRSRKDYVRAWWRPDQMRGCVFLEESLPSEKDHGDDDGNSLPPTCISEDTSRFRYTYRNGLRSAIRVARMVSETVALNLPDVRWFVFGDDDTVFVPENLAKTLSKYDHELWYYVGTYSEIYEQNLLFGFGMAFGGAGFAISYPLAKVLAKVFDSCIQRYPHLYGSDSRVYSCVTELGVQLTREPGFHQIDIHGDMFGLLTSHPVTPLVSLHHLDHTYPIFPNMASPNQALQHLFRAASVDPQRILQRSVCYDKWFSWTIVVSWGYAVQVHGRHVQLPDLNHVPRTFRKWKNRPTVLSGVYTFITKDVDPDPCRRPTVFFMENVTSSGRNAIETTYRKYNLNCPYDSSSPKKLGMVRVSSSKLDLSIKQLKAPRRHCCDVLPSSVSEIMDIAIRECDEEELIHMH